MCVNETKCERELDAADSGAVSHSDASHHGNSSDMGRITYSTDVLLTLIFVFILIQKVSRKHLV